MKILSKIKNFVKHICKFLCLLFSKVRDFLVDYWYTLFPNYKKILSNSGRKKEAIEYIRKLDKEISKKYIIYRIVIIILILIMFNAIKNVIAKKLFSITLVLYVNLQLWGLFMGFIGTIFLAKGFLKSPEQIVLESTSLGSKSTFAESLIRSKYDALVGLLFIACSFLFQILALVFSVFI